MILYEIPDIRLFWSRDSGFLDQFSSLKPAEVVKYRPISVHPQLYMDLSFWLPRRESANSLSEENHEMKSQVFDTIRNVSGDLIEQVSSSKLFYN